MDAPPGQWAQTWGMTTHIAALALFTALPAAAADPATSLDRLLACAGIADAVPRLECFDRGVAAVRAPAINAAPVVAAAPATSSAPAPEPQTATAPLVEARPSETAAVVQARIVASGRSSGGLYYVTLDNGQTWRHESGSMEPYLKVGEAVTISKGSLGSHRLTLDSSKSKNWVRVTRLR